VLHILRSASLPAVLPQLGREEPAQSVTLDSFAISGHLLHQGEISILCASQYLPLASVVLFARSNKDGYDKSDITITYISFFGTVVREVAQFFISLSCMYLLLCFPALQLLCWQDVVAQHNIMSFCARSEEAPNSDEACYLQLPQGLHVYINT
jgi:hypothetical protein